MCTPCPPLHGQQSDAEDGAQVLTQGWYVVRPGDTLEDISGRFLGNSQLWRLHLPLNSQVTNPNLVYPGQDLRIATTPVLPEGTAKVIAVSRDVEKNPVPITWRTAVEDDLLLTDDGVRTFEDSSMEVVFSDGANLVLTENSMVFLKGPQRPAAPPRAVEIVHGQADLEAPAAELFAGLEIVVGNAAARPEADESGAETRARRDDDGGAALMVYRGSSEVEAAGATVNVGSGMGTTVPEAGPPAPPEELLPSPVLSSPANGSDATILGLTMEWQPLAGAHTYTAEVCHDPRCSRLVTRQTEIEDTRWAPSGLGEGPLCWRVTAVSASGLDGFPSPVSCFTAYARPLDTTPPSGEIRVLGPSVEHQGRLCLGQGARLDLLVEDADSGPAPWQGQLDGVSVAADTWRGQWSPGEHSAAATIADQAGNQAELPALHFTFDTQGPELRPRAVPWNWREHRGSTGRARPESADRSGGPPIVWSIRGTSWLPFGSTFWVLEAPDARLALRGKKARHQLRLHDSDVILGDDQILLVEPVDPCGLKRLRYGLEPAAGGWTLVLEATDQLGNTSSRRLRLTVD
jgi:hypothetical protein